MSTKSLHRVIRLAEVLLAADAFYRWAGPRAYVRRQCGIEVPA